MINRIALALSFALAASQGQAPWDKIWTSLGKRKGLSNETVVSGLKEALRVASGNAVSLNGKVDGYFRNAAIKILMPEKLKPVEKGLRMAGQSRQADEFVLSMNRAAERAAPFAKDIFWEAIKRMTFSDAASVLPYLPAIGVFAPLNSSAFNPIQTASGGFGGEVLGLQLNVDFSDAGFLPGASGIRFGDLVLENFSTLTVLNGLTVRQFLGDANTLLGGGSSIVTIAGLDTTVGELNGSFFNGTPGAFAQQHLVAPTPANAE